MIDYWNKLKLDECWSKKQRYNKIMNFLLDGEDAPQDKTDDSDEEKFSNISVLVTDEDNNPVNQATVTINDGVNDYVGTTGTAGGCTIKNVPFGNYDVTTTAEGFITDIDTLTVNSESMSLEIMLGEQEGPMGVGGQIMEEEEGEW